MNSAQPGPVLLADLTEDRLLELLFPIFGVNPSPDERVLVSAGDDAALLAASGPVLATTDAVVRGIDWRDDWSSAADVGGKVVAQNVADIAAMGGRCTSLLLTLAVDPATTVEWVLDLANGIAQAAAEADVRVVGGDLSSAPSGIVMISVTALGRLDGRSPVLRSGARPGDLVVLSGSLGWSAAGLELLQTAAANYAPADSRTPTGSRAPGAPGAPSAPDLVAYHRRPRLLYEQGPIIAAAGASALIDLSDGLLRDAGRIAKASGVHLRLDAEALKPDIDTLSTTLERTQAVRCVLTGGEEHSLLACLPPESLVPARWRVIGHVEDGAHVAGVGVSITGMDEQVHALGGGGWDHFAP